VAAVPGLGPGSRVLNVGSGTGCLIPHLRGAGVRQLTVPGRFVPGRFVCKIYAGRVCASLCIA